MAVAVAVAMAQGEEVKIVFLRYTVDEKLTNAQDGFTQTVFYEITS